METGQTICEKSKVEETMLIKVLLPIIAVWWAIVWAYTFDGFKEEIDAQDDFKYKLAGYFAFALYPAIVAPLLVYMILRNLVKFTCKAFVWPLEVFRTRHSGRVFLTQEKYHDGKRRYGWKEFNHHDRR